MKAPAGRYDSRRNLQIDHAGMARFSDTTPALTGGALRPPRRTQEVRKPSPVIIQRVQGVKPALVRLPLLSWQVPGNAKRTPAYEPSWKVYRRYYEWGE